MPKKYGTTFTDLIQFGSTVSNYYAMFAGTDEADLIYNISRTIQSPIVGVIPDEAGAQDDEYDEFKEGEEIDGGFLNVDYQAIRKEANSEQITDDIYVKYDLDMQINGYIVQLDNVLASGKYPEGSIERTLLTHTKNGLERIINRELCFNDKSEYGSYLVNATITSKVANNGLVPILPEKVLNGLKPDNVNFNFVPNSDSKRAAYTKEELQESADKTNFSGGYREGLHYMDSFYEFTDVIGMDKPDTADRQQILKNKMLGEVIALRNELYKITNVNLNDPVIARINDGIETNVADMYGVENARSYYQHIAKCDNLENYLRSGMPVEGYADYANLHTNLVNVREFVKGAYEFCSNADGLYNAFAEYEDKVTGLLPGPGSSEAEIKAFQDEVGRLARNLNNEFDKFKNNRVLREMPGNLTKTEESNLKSRQNSFMDQLRAGDGMALNDFSRLVSYASDFEALGNRSYVYFHGKYVDFMEDMEEDKANIRDALRRYQKAHGSHYDEDVSKAIEDTVKLCENKYSTPDELNEALGKCADIITEKQGLMMDGPDDVRRTAERHYEPLREYINRTKAHHDNLIKGAKKRGILTDISVDKQLLVEKRNGEIHLDEAIELFNTSRFMGGENTEHRLAREAAQRLQEKYNELKAIDKKANPKEWRELAETVNFLAETAIVRSDEYQAAKNYHANLPAGKRRLEGSEKIKEEAVMLRAMINKEFRKDEIYNKIKAETRIVEPLPVDELNKMREAKDKEAVELATKEAFKAVMKNEKVPASDKMDSFISAYCMATSGDEKLSTIASDVLKNSAFNVNRGTIKLDDKNTEQFFKDFGKFCVDARLDYIKDIKANPAKSPIGDNMARAMITDEIIDNFGTFLDEPCIRRYNNSLSEKDIAAGKKITAQKIKEWYDTGRSERMNELPKEELDVYHSRDEIISNAMKESNIPEADRQTAISNARRAYGDKMTAGFEIAYEETYADQEARLAQRAEKKALENEARKNEIASNRAKAKQAVERQNAEKERLKEEGPKKLDLKQLKEKSGFTDHHENNAHGRRTVSSRTNEHEIHRTNSLG